MELTHCPHCHERLNPPRKHVGCVCDAWEWCDPGNIPPPCSEYVGDGSQFCAKCEHEKACHTTPDTMNSDAPQ